MAFGPVSIGGSSYVLPPATKESLGGIIVGDDLTVDEQGKINLPVATATTLGGIKSGKGLEIRADGTASIDAYNTAETDAMLDELQGQVSKMVASGQPVAVWSYYASFSSLHLYTYNIPDSVDYIAVKKDPGENASQVIVPRGKTGAMGYFSVDFSESKILKLYADSPSGHTLYFVGYHYLTAADGVKFPYAVDTKSFKVNEYYGTSFTVDTNVDYIVMEWITEEKADGSSSSVTVRTRYSEIIARGTLDDATDRFSSSGTVKINSNGGKYVNITMYHYATPEELNNRLVAAESALADADALNLDQDYRLTLLELGASESENEKTE